MIEDVSNPFGVSPDGQRTTQTLFTIGIKRISTKFKDRLSALKDKITLRCLWYFNKP